MCIPRDTYPLPSIPSSWSHTVSNRLDYFRIVKGRPSHPTMCRRLWMISHRTYCWLDSAGHHSRLKKRYFVNEHAKRLYSLISHSSKPIMSKCAVCNTFLPEWKLIIIISDIAHKKIRSLPRRECRICSFFCFLGSLRLRLNGNPAKAGISSNMSDMVMPWRPLRALRSPQPDTSQYKSGFGCRVGRQIGPT